MARCYFACHCRRREAIRHSTRDMKIRRSQEPRSGAPCSALDSGESSYLLHGDASASSVTCTAMTGLAAFTPSSPPSGKNDQTTRRTLDIERGGTSATVTPTATAWTRRPGAAEPKRLLLSPSPCARATDELAGIRVEASQSACEGRRGFRQVAVDARMYSSMSP